MSALLTDLMTTIGLVEVEQRTREDKAGKIVDEARDRGSLQGRKEPRPW